jgi:hypothetical protein
MPHKATRIARWVLLGLALAALFAFVLGFLVAWLWNAVMPAVFGLGEISYWQAVGLLFLAKIFFGGGHHGPPHHTKDWKRKTAFHRRHGDSAPISNIPEDQQEPYKRYWEEQGKAAFDAYISNIKPERSEE